MFVSKEMAITMPTKAGSRKKNTSFNCCLLLMITMYKSYSLTEAIVNYLY